VTGRPQTVLGATLRASELRGADIAFDLAASPHELGEIARRLGLEAVEELTARLAARRWGRGGATVEGSLAARVVQLCVITLEPVASDIAAEVSEKFVPVSSTPREVLIDIADPDDAEPFSNGEIDIGQLVVDTLAGALDPYPRAPGAEVELPAGETPGGDDDSASPFAGLARLKGEEGAR
jgi:uncharacterized metal-binding protein YceD (DUF177 family)